MTEFVRSALETRLLPRRAVPLLVLAVLGTLLVRAGSVATADSANPRTPGNFTGIGFDQCDTPSQHKMDVWRQHSPFRAVGIYISGNSRFCRDQPNLTATWVHQQLMNGWHLLPITLGPQASCQPRFPRYGPAIDPTISPKSAYTYAAARAQGRAEALKTVGVARDLGLVRGSTMFYDLEGFDLNHSTACRQSALWFLSAWTNQLHRSGYLSGVYSSAGSGIVMLDDARVTPPQHYVGPDLIWLARWNGKANTSATNYVSNDGWADHRRVKQYVGGHDEKWGRVTINIDRDYLDVRKHRVPGPVAGPPGPPPSTADPECTRASISRPAYRRTSATMHQPQIVALQCLLKQRHLYTHAVTGTWNQRTTSALAAFQRRVGRPVHAYATRGDWVALLTAGSANIVLQRGSTGADVIRVQRAMNAASSARLTVSGTYGKTTEAAVTAYQKKVIGPSTGVVASMTWRALHQGQW